MCISLVDYMFMHIESPVPDPDLEIKGGGRGGGEERGGGQPDP